jgi:EAL domain-containing protein (putative c-di-GMP-specific phosphodiesterase class I)
MVFQPVVSWTAKSLFAYEALVRSREETLSQPRELFDAAERLNQLPELTYRIHAACAQQLKSLPEYALLFVNLHIKELLLVDEFARMSELVPYAGRVVLELTERASFEQVSDMSTRVARLRSYGFRIALDDMGAGFAGLTSFASLDPDVVKLDTVLIRDVDSMPLKRRLVSSMTRLCSELGIQVVAEGVETVNERDTLCELGCDLMQGYFFAQPSDTTVSPLVS